MSLVALKKRLKTIRRLKEVEESQVKILFGNLSQISEQITQLRNECQEVNRATRQMTSGQQPLGQATLQHLGSTHRLVNALNERIATMEVRQQELAEEYQEQSKKIRGWEKLEDKLHNQVEAEEAVLENLDATDRFLSQSLSKPRDNQAE